MMGPVASTGAASALENAVLVWPTPVADALLLLLDAESPFERRDRIVEVFRAQLRLLAALALAARLQFGAGPEPPSAQVGELLRQLRGRGLTDGQWLALLRELLRPWSSSPDAHPLAALVRPMFARKSELLKLWEELLVMRKSETVAHGASGTRDELDAIVSRRLPQLDRTFALTSAVWSALSLACPRERAAGEPPRAALLVGPTPSSGRFRRVPLQGGEPPPGELLLIDPEGRPRLALHPVVTLVRVRDLDRVFVLDGPAKRGATLVSFPSMLEHRDPSGFDGLEEALPTAEVDDAPASARGASPVRPYRGLASFGPEEASLFFGREREAEALANRIRVAGFVTVTGASGSGKTSLLRAGALPALKDVSVAFVRPGAHPLASLASRVSEALELQREETVALLETPEQLRARIESFARATGQLFVLVVDQAEELLTVTQDPRERELFARCLAALGHADGRTRVVLSVREDFFARLATIAPLVGVFSREVEIVTTPGREELLRILVLPAKAFGYDLEDLELGEEIVDEVSSANASLALLSFAADRLWEARDRRWKRLTRVAYEAFGGVRGALASHADGVFEALASSEQGTCRSLMMRLVTPERTRAICSRKELLASARDPAEATRVLDRLVVARLVTALEDAAGESTVEILHEALIAHWGRLGQWLSEDEDGQRMRHALRQVAREWEARAQPRGLLWRGELLVELRLFMKRARDPLAPGEAAFAEAAMAQERRDRRLRVGALIAAFASLALFGAFMYRESERAKRATRESEERRVEVSREKTGAEISALVAEARGLEARGLVDEARALQQGAVALQTELGETRATPELMNLGRLALEGAGAHTESVLLRPAQQLLSAPSQGLLIALGSDDDAVVFDTRADRVATRLPVPGLLAAAALSPDERFLAVSSANARSAHVTTRLHALPSGTLLWEATSLPLGTRLAFDPDSTSLWHLGMAGELFAFEVSSPPPKGLEPVARDVSRMAVGPLGLHVVARGRTATLEDPSLDAPRVFDVAAPVSALAISDDGQLLAVGDEAGRLVVFSVAIGERLLERIVHAEKALTEIRFDGRHVVATSIGGRVFAQDLDTRRSLSVEAGTGTPKIDVERGLLAVARGTRAELYDLASGLRVASRRAHEDDTHAVALHGGRLASTGWDKRVRLDPDGATRIVRSLPFSSDHEAAAFSDGARRVAVFGRPDDGRTPPGLLVTDLEGSAARHTPMTGFGMGLAGDATLERVAALTDRELVFVGPEGARRADLAGRRGRSLAASADLSKVYVGDQSGGLWQFDARGDRLAQRESVGDAITQLATTSDGRLVATLGDGVRVFGGDGLEDVWTFDAQRFNTFFAFSPDGGTFAVAAQGSITVLETVGFGVLFQLEVPDLTPSLVRFDPAGARLAVGSSSSGPDALRVLDLGAGTVETYDSPAGTIDVLFSRDGRRVATAGSDGAVTLWQDGVGVPLRVQPFDAASMRLAFGAEEDTLIGTSAQARAFALDVPLVPREGLPPAGNLRVCRDRLAVVEAAAPSESPWATAEDCRPRR
jgi:hypothetical protein